MKLLAFTALKDHGVPKEHIAVLQGRFGPGFPHGVTDPGDVMHWMLHILPWTSLHPVLRAHVERALVRGGGDVHQDVRARRALALLKDDPEEQELAGSLRELRELIDTFTRVKGIKSDSMGELITNPGTTPEMRAWAAAYIGVIAASAALAHDEHELAAQTMSVAAWTISQLDDPSEKEAELDGFMRDLTAAVVRFVGSFVGWNPHKGAQA